MGGRRSACATLRCPGAQAHSLTVGGMLWFTDLTASDPYYGLPVMCAAATIAMVARGMNIDGMAVTEGQRGQQKMVKCAPPQHLCSSPLGCCARP